MVQLILQLLRQGWQPLRELWQEGGIEEAVFANRNRAYGAYVLRRNEGWHLLTALSIVVGGLLSVGWISTQIKTAKAEIEYEYRVLQLSKGFENAVLPPPPCPPPIMHRGVYWQKPTPAPLAEVLAEREVIGLGLISEPEPKLDTLLYAAVLDTPDHPLEIEPLEAPRDWLIPEIEETEADIPDVIQEEMPDVNSFVIVSTEPKPLNLWEIVKLAQVPQIARDAGISATVIFRVLIGKDGRYRQHEVLKGHPLIAKPYEDYLPLLRCKPAMQGDKAVAYWINIPFNICFID